MTRWQKPGRFGHVKITGVCECPRSTIDSENVVFEPVSVSEGGLWGMFFCLKCGGTGVLNVSCQQRLLEIFSCAAVPSIMDLWMNPISEPSQPKT